MSLTDALTRFFMKRALATKEGRAHILNSIADSEDEGESRFFDDLLGHVDDEKLQKMIRLHRADEVRHGELFRNCRDRQGFDPGPVPEQIQALVRLDEHLGGFFERGIRSDRDVAEAFLVLKVIEERALQQFGLIEPIIRKHDPETADVFLEVSKDEARHLKYCDAVSKRYMPDEALRQRRLQQIREVEARAFVENNAAFTQYMLDQGYLRGAFNRTFFPMVLRMSQRSGALPFTEHYSKSPLALAT